MNPISQTKWVVVGAMILASANAKASGNASATTTLYVLTQSTGEIDAFDLFGNKTFFGSAGTSVALGLARDAQGNFYASAWFSDSIQAFTPSGVRFTFATTMYEPTGLAFDTSGNLFVAGNYFNEPILKITPGGQQSVFASNISPAGGMAFDSHGNLFVAARQSLLKITPAGGVSAIASGILASRGVAVDPSDDVFVADAYANRVLKFEPNGTESIFASGLTEPTAMACDSQGNLYVAAYGVSYGNGTIERFDPNGHGSIIVSGLANPSGIVVVETPEPSPWAVAAFGMAVLLGLLRLLVSGSFRGGHGTVAGV